MTLTIRELKRFINTPGFTNDTLITDMHLQNFVHITHDLVGNIRLCISRPIGKCNRTDEYVYPSIVNGYTAYCPELDEDLYDFEWRKIDHKSGDK